MSRSIRPRWRLRVHHDGLWLLSPMWSLTYWTREAARARTIAWCSTDRVLSGRLGFLLIEKRGHR